MDLTTIIIMLVIGGVAGWLAGIIMKGRSLGLIGNIVVGIIGSFIGGFVLGKLGFLPAGIVGAIISATIGAIILLLIIGLIKKA